jgi:hypothetical protein
MLGCIEQIRAGIMVKLVPASTWVGFHCAWLTQLEATFDFAIVDSTFLRRGLQRERPLTRIPPKG